MFIIVDDLPIKKLFNFDLFVGDLFQGKELIQWESFKSKYGLTNVSYFKFRQILAAIPRRWKKIVEEADTEIEFSRPCSDVLKLSRMVPIEKLTAKYSYGILLHNLKLPPTSESKIMQKINKQNVDWKSVYTLMNYSTLDSYARIFHFKCTHNVLYLNEKLHKIGLKENPKCSFCKIYNENIYHLFY